jgi:tetratricopeptide (TPR) repeat protein
VLGCFLIVTLGLGTPARAADIATQAQEAYDSAKYEDALKLWFSSGSYDQLSADTLYNIGNAAYRSGSPGQAALYYRRALARNSNHQEARQNLRFIERKYGAIVVQRPEYQYALAKIPLATWQAVFWGGLWLCGLALLVFPATRTGAKLRVAAVGVLVLGPLLISIGILGWRYFPNDAEFAPLAKQAVIIAEKAALHTDAARTAPEVIDAPPGSLCEIITESGRWAYVAFATKTRGWVPLESIEKIIPEKPPEAPKFRKPKADGKSA